MGSSSVRQVVSRRCGIATIDSPLQGQAVGPKSLVGADSRRPFRACAGPRDDLSPAHAHAPVPAERSAARSPLCDVETRCWPWSKSWIPREGRMRSSRGLAASDSDGVGHVGSLNVSSRASRSHRAPRTLRAAPACRITLYGAIRSARWPSSHGRTRMTVLLVRLGRPPEAAADREASWQGSPLTRPPTNQPTVVGCEPPQPIFLISSNICLAWTAPRTSRRSRNLAWRPIGRCYASQD